MIALWLALGCGPAAVDSSPSGGTPTGTTPTGTRSTTPSYVATSGPAVELRALAEAEGWTVQDGLFVFSTMEHCCDVGVSCLGNNPATPYGLVALPPAPNSALEREHDTFWMWGDLPWPGMSRTYRMRANEAVVIVGEAPPASKYFGLRSSVATRYLPESDMRGLALGSMGPVTNHLSVAAERGTSPEAFWGSPLAVVSTADERTELTVDGWLAEIGFGAHTHHDRISSPDTRLGVTPEADEMMIAARVAVPEDPGAMAAYEASPPLQVLRLTPPEGSTTSPMPRPALPARGAGLDEDAWLPAVDALDAAVRDRFAGWIALEHGVNGGFTETFDCMDDLSCIGDVRDRYAARVPTFTLAEDEVVVVYGVNHERTGRAAYANFAVMVEDNWVGAAAVNSDEMVGSARGWLDDPLVDDLYAWILARDCSPFSDPCLEVSTDCPWPTLSEGWWITWRMYLDPVSGAAPADDEMLLDRMVRFRPAP